MSFWESLARGAAQGATMGFGDEGVSQVLAALPTDDGTGIPREYAAGSAEDDYLQSERAANAAAAEDNPLAFAAGAAAGGLPAAMAVPSAGGVAGAGLTSGLMGAIRGAGSADGGDMAQSVGRNAGFGALLGAGGAAISAAAPAVKNVLASIGDDIAPTGMAPAYATVGGGASRVAAPSALPGGAQISRAAMLPPRPSSGDLGQMPSIPRAPKPLMPEAAVDASEDLADAAIIANSAKAELGGGATPSQIDRLVWAQNKFDRMGGNGPVAPKAPKAANTEASVQKTVPPKRGPRAGAGRTVPAPVKSLPPSAVRPPQQTVPAPAPSATPSMKPTMAPEGRPTMPVSAGRDSMRPTMPAPGERPTMIDLGPVKPTLKPPTEAAYMEEVLRQMRENL